MMNMNRFIPPGLRIIQSILYFKRKMISRSPKFNNMYTTKFRMSTALGFLWLSKSKQEPEVKDNKEQLQTLLVNADMLYENGRYEECYQLLSNYQEQDVEIRWRTSRTLYNMSKEHKYDTNYKKDLTFLAYEIIAKELDSHSQHSAVQKWYAVLLDAKSAYEGIKERIKQLENVKKHMDIAISINPNDATTLHMLGEWCFQISEMPWHQRMIAEAIFASPPHSSYEDALTYFLKAEEAQPRFYSLNLLRLGNCYLRLNKEDQAKYYLKLAASYPAKSNEDHHTNKQAAELLKKLKCQ